MTGSLIIHVDYKFFTAGKFFNLTDNLHDVGVKFFFTQILADFRCIYELDYINLNRPVNAGDFVKFIPVGFPAGETDICVCNFLRTQHHKNNKKQCNGGRKNFNQYIGEEELDKNARKGKNVHGHKGKPFSQTKKTEAVNEIKSSYKGIQK